MSDKRYFDNIKRIEEIISRLDEGKHPYDEVKRPYNSGKSLIEERETILSSYQGTVEGISQLN